MPAGFTEGIYFEPTIVANTGKGLSCYDEELFGPVLSVETFETEGEAVAKASETRFGLASGVFTRDLARAHHLIRRIHAGIVWVNAYRAVSPLMPFGGYGHSGLGREGGAEAMLEQSRVKSVWIRTTNEPIADPFVMP